MVHLLWLSVRPDGAAGFATRDQRGRARYLFRCGPRRPRTPHQQIAMGPVEYAGRGGWIEVISGVMFSGKSEELLRRVRRATLARRSVQVFKSHLDERYGGLGSVGTHDGGRIPSEPVSSSLEVMERVRPQTQVVAIDEAQFLDAGIVEVANSLADRGVRVIIAGTDMDFRGHPFGPIGQLLAIAEKVDKLHAICVVCGQLATRNQRLIDGSPAPAEGPTIQVGGLESYEARCRECHAVPTVTRSQITLLE
jgi:thymidine kinase